MCEVLGSVPSTSHMHGPPTHNPSKESWGRFLAKNKQEDTLEGHQVVLTNRSSGREGRWGGVLEEGGERV